MVSKKTLKEYDFNSIEDYFNMTIESKFNGQLSQAKEQFKKMDKGQKLEFIEFVRLSAPDHYDFFMQNIF